MEESTPEENDHHRSTELEENQKAKRKAKEKEENSTTISPTKKDDSEHNTLKYHLLGPSLTKAGQDAVDQQKVLI